MFFEMYQINVPTSMNMEVTGGDLKVLDTETSWIFFPQLKLKDKLQNAG